jgi:GTP-binding protein HflX
LDVGHPHAQQQFDSVHKVLNEIGAKEKPELLLLNKIDTDEGEESYPFWRTLHPDAIAISARTGKGIADLHEAVYSIVRGQQVNVLLEADVTNGRLLAFIESNTRVMGREVVDGSRIQIRAVMGKKTLADLARNDQVEVVSVGDA